MEFYIIFAILLLSNSQVFCQTVCTCDLTASICDVNCCCDADCSSALVATFPCSDATFNTDSKLCDNTIVFVNNIPTTEVVQENGVFCIVTDNRQERNSYTAPVLITTQQEFDSTLQQYPTYTYDLSTPSPVTGTYYKAGDTIDIQYPNGILGKFPSPVSGIASTCLDNNPASFLNDEQSTCNRQVDSSMCDNLNVLDVNLYMTFRVAKLPVINATNLTSADFVNVTLCNQSVANAPTLINGSPCINAATQITYQISFNGTSGISSVCLSYVIGNISVSSAITQWPQTYNVIYLSAANSNLSVVDEDFRSGNPGYVTGKPLRTAISSAGNLTLAPNQLHLIPQTPTGLCSDAAAATSLPINFREDARTGCLLSYDSTTVCTDIYNSISLLLNISTNIFVSTFGNTLVSSPGDWIGIISTFPVAPATVQSVAELCEGTPVSLNYNVFYANTNNISNPQPKIIGIEVAVQTTTVSYQCPGWNCVASQYLEVTSSVTFIDTSSSPAAVLKERPTVDARLPSDFFFPFTSN